MSDKSYKKYKTYSRDEIMAFTDKELFFAVNQMRSNIREARKRGGDTISLEVEFCYLDNERQRREAWGSSSSSDSRKREYRKEKKESQPVKPRSYNR